MDTPAARVISARLLTGLHHLGRRDLPPPVALALTGLTATYAVIGAARVVRDLAHG